MTTSRCTDCGQISVVEMRGEFTMRVPPNVPGESITIRDATWYQCKSCGDRLLPYELAKAIDVVRFQRLGIEYPVISLADESPGPSLVGGTQLARSPDAEQREILLKNLRPWLPGLLKRGGLDPVEALVDTVINMIRDRLPIQDTDGGLRMVLPRWLAEFVEEEIGRSVPATLFTIDHAYIAETAVTMTLSREREDETPIDREVRNYLLGKGLKTPDQILAARLPPHLQNRRAESALGALRSHAVETKNKGMIIFELAA